MVDLCTDAPLYFIVPEWWIENDIHVAHNEYLEQHGGHRARNDASEHHRIRIARVEQRRDRWDLLGIFPER